MKPPFDLFLFSTNPPFIREAVAAGVAGVVIDWENAEKRDRQRHADTEINYQTVDDLQRVRATTRAQIICRINRYGESTRREIESALAGGADEILLPMVRTVDEVAAVLQLVDGRCGLGILVETVAAVDGVRALSRLPLCRVYVGLNDLAIDRGVPNIFSAVLDCTVERVRSFFDVPFGFAGLTLIHAGHPIPSRLLMAEMARLDCQFSFLRRSFHSDIRERQPGHEIPLMLQAIAAARARGPEEVAIDRQDLDAAVRGWSADWPVPVRVAR